MDLELACDVSMAPDRVRVASSETDVRSSPPAISAIEPEMSASKWKRVELQQGVEAQMSEETEARDTDEDIECRTELQGVGSEGEIGREAQLADDARAYRW